MRGRPRRASTPATLLLFFLPRRIAVEHLVLATLQPGVANERVAVERGLLDDALGLEQAGARAHLVEPPPRPVDAAIVDRLVVVPAGIHYACGRIARGAGAQERDHEVGPRRHAPPAERLSEILVVLLEPEGGRDVPQAENAEYRVHHESTGVGGA